MNRLTDRDQMQLELANDSVHSSTEKVRVVGDTGCDWRQEGKKEGRRVGEALRVIWERDGLFRRGRGKVLLLLLLLLLLLSSLLLVLFVSVTLIPSAVPCLSKIVLVPVRDRQRGACLLPFFKNKIQAGYDTPPTPPYGGKNSYYYVCFLWY